MANPQSPPGTPIAASVETEDAYCDEEAQRRFEAITRAVLNMPPKPRKAVVEKGRESKRKKTGEDRPPLADDPDRP